MKRKLFSIRYLLFFLVATLGAASIFTGCSSEKDNPTITYTVSFKTNNSTVLKAKKIEKGKTVTKPTAPNKSGYTFEGWYTTASFTGDPYNFGTAVTGSFTLYAKFTAAATSQATAPGAPTGVVVSGVPAKTQIIITWTAPANKGKKKDGTVATVKYEVQYKAGSSTAWLPVTPSSVAGGVTTFTVSTLTAGTAYDFQVKAVNADDTTKKSVFSTVATIRTAAAGPPITLTALKALAVACNGGDNTKCAEVSTANTSQITDMSKLFKDMASFNTDISNWDVSKVTTMALMFQGARKFNKPLNSWKTSSVTTMALMFQGARKFNQDINSWKTSSVTTMNGMFNNATNFNQPLKDWDVSKVTNIYGMFFGAASFNQPLKDWDVSSVTDMNVMFYGATAFNQDLSGWTVSQVTNHDNFSLNSALTTANSPNWGGVTPTSKATAPGAPTGVVVSGVPTESKIIITWTAPANKGKKKDGTVATVKYEVQYKAGSSTAWLPVTPSSVAGGVTTFTVSTLTAGTAYDFQVKAVNADDTTKKSAWTMTATPISTAAGATTGGSPLTLQQLKALAVACNGGDNTKCAEVSTANTSQITDMNNLFRGMTSFNTDISNWDTSSVTNMHGMFYRALNFNKPLKDWDVSSVTNMSNMFFRATSFNKPLKDWDVSKVTNMEYMFYNASNFNKPLKDWDVSKVITMAFMFSSASSFNQPLNSWKTSSVTIIRNMFEGATNFNQDINSWNIGSVTSMIYMFSKATNFNQPLNNWDTSSVTNMYGMFNRATAFNQNLSAWDVSQVTNHSFFSDNSALTAANSPVWK